MSTELLAGEAVELLDQQRRMGVRLILLTVLGVTGLVSGLALVVQPDTRVVGLTTAAVGVLILVVRALAPRVSEPLVMTALIVLSLVALFLPVLLNNGQPGGAAFFVGALTLLVMASASSRVAWVALGATALVLAAQWLLCWWLTGGLNTLATFSWWRAMVEGAILAAITVTGVWVQLRLVDEATADLERERERVDRLAAQVAAENAQLERQAGERMAELDRLERDRDQLAADLREASSVDPGSGLANQRRWESQLPVVLASARESGTMVCVSVVDIDSFSEINNSHGHQAGDAVIRRVAQRLGQSSPAGTLVARIGGEEFALAMSGVDARLTLDRMHLLQAAVAAEPWADIAVGLRPTFSAGVVEVAPDVPGDVAGVAREATHRADLAMQRAKRAGRDRVMLADPL